MLSYALHWILLKFWVRNNISSHNFISQPKYEHFLFFSPFFGVLENRILNPGVPKCHEDIIALETYICVLCKKENP